MGESEHHAHLVAIITEWIQAKHGDNRGLSLLVDARHVPVGRRPGQIAGYTPDVHCRTIPASFVILGEAKTFSDFLTPRTAPQLTAFIRFLTMQPDPTLVLATPLGAEGAARSLVRRIHRHLGGRVVPTVFLQG